MSRVLVTGATGFVGRQVVEALIARGHTPVCAIRRGTADRLPAGVNRVVESDDLFAEDSDWWRARLAGIDLCIHLAWVATPGRYLTDPRNLACLQGTLSLGQGAIEARLPRLVGCGTCFEYDTAPGVLSVDTPLRPTSPYAAAKSAAYMALDALLPPAGVSFLWARLFHVHGRGEDPRRLIAYLHDRLSRGEPAELGRGTQIRDFIDVRDAAAMLVSDALGPAEGAINIATGTGMTVRAMAEQIAAAYGRADLLRFGVRADNHTDPPCVVGLRPDTLAASGMTNDKTGELRWTFETRSATA